MNLPCSPFLSLLLAHVLHICSHFLALLSPCALIRTASARGDKSATIADINRYERGRQTKYTDVNIHPYVIRGCVGCCRASRKMHLAERKLVPPLHVATFSKKSPPRYGRSCSGWTTTGGRRPNPKCHRRKAYYRAISGCEQPRCAVWRACCDNRREFTIAKTRRTVCSRRSREITRR